MIWAALRPAKRDFGWLKEGSGFAVGDKTMISTRRTMVKMLGTAVILVFAAGLLIAGPQKTVQAATWSQVNIDGFGDIFNGDAPTLEVFNNRLYASTTNFPFLGGTGTQVWRYLGFGSTNWELVNTAGFGDAGNVDSMLKTFNGALYAVTSNSSGVELWKTTDGTTWTPVADGGFGNANNTLSIPMEIFGGELYIGVSNAVEGGRVFRVDGSDNIAAVSAVGFGNPANTEALSLEAYNGKLYAGTTNAAGAEIWSSSDGITWAQAMTGGFGDTNNISIMTLFGYNSELYAGTSHSATAQLWRTQGGNENSWEQISLPVGIDATISHQRMVINSWAVIGTYDGTLYISADGSTWTQEGLQGFGDVGNMVVSGMTFWEGRPYVAFGNGRTGTEVWAAEEGPRLSLTDETLPDGTAGEDYRECFDVSNGTPPYTYSITNGDLPDGLRLEDGCIVGRSTEGGEHTFTVTVTDSGIPPQTFSREYTLTINEAEEAEELPATGADWPLIRLFLI